MELNTRHVVCPGDPLLRGDRRLHGALAGGCGGGGEGGASWSGTLGEFPGLGRMNLSLELQFGSIFPFTRS